MGKETDYRPIDVEKESPHDMNAYLLDAREMFVSFFSRHRGPSFPVHGITGGLKQDIARGLLTIDNEAVQRKHRKRQYMSIIDGFRESARIWPFLRGGFLLSVYQSMARLEATDDPNHYLHNGMYLNEPLLLLNAVLLPESLSRQPLETQLKHLYDHHNKTTPSGLLSRFKKKDTALVKVTYKAVEDGDLIHVEWCSDASTHIMGKYHTWQRFPTEQGEDGLPYMTMIRNQEPETSPLSVFNKDQIHAGSMNVDPFVYGPIDGRTVISEAERVSIPA